jgi:glyoxylase-like metal-dependent hydrolase (beta-lactamase superfamily II)
MKVYLVPVTPFEQNCSIIVCEKTHRCAVVDPGGDLDRILEAIETSGATLEKILITHGHADHCAGTSELRRRTGVPVEGPQREETFWIDQLPASAARFGFPPAEAFTPDRWLEDGDTVTVGELVLDVRHCPGHTPGHVIFFERGERVAFVGDVIFEGSVGRTDFPRGDTATLIRSITEKLWPLGDDVTFVPGHGSTSTFGAERRSNPFVADEVLARQR